MTVHTCSHAFVFEALLMTGLACYMGLFDVIWTTVVLCTCLYMCSLWSLTTGAAVFNVVFTESVLYGFVFWLCVPFSPQVSCLCASFKKIVYPTNVLDIFGVCLFCLFVYHRCPVILILFTCVFILFFPRCPCAAGGMIRASSWLTDCAFRLPDMTLWSGWDVKSQ